MSILSSVRSITGAQQVRWIGVAPAVDTAFALGDTVQLATTITDGHGGVLPGVSVGWTSTDTSVALVDSAGTVIVRSPGAATIVAAAGGRIAQSRILVRPRAAAIQVFGDTAVRLPEGGTVRLVARVVDARRHPVPGQSLAWRTADAAIAAVDSSARLTAGTAGHTVVIATAGDITTEISLDVVPVAGTITVLAGDGQHAPAGRRLAIPLRAQVVSRGGRPLPGVAVRLGQIDGAAVEQASDTSDADGIVQLPWTLGPRPGRQRAALVVDGDAAVSTQFTAEADPLPDNTRILLAGTAPTGQVGAALAGPIAVQVTDSMGAALPDLPVAWTADGDGSIEGQAARTDSLGMARARWALGTRAGEQRAFVQVGSPRSVPRFAVVATARPGAAASVVVERGMPARGIVGRELDRPLVLRVADRSNNPVAGSAVTLRAGMGSIAEHTLVSDSSGRVPVRWTLGPTAGPQRLVASAQGVERAVEVTAQARAGSVARVAIEGLPASGPAGVALAQPVAVLVTDSLRNPVAGALVAFTSRSGRITPARVRTDSPDTRACAGRLRPRRESSGSRSWRRRADGGQRGPCARQPHARGSDNRRTSGLAQHLDDDALPTLAVPLPVEHPLPGPEVQPSGRDRHDHLVAHRQAPQVSRGVVLTGLVVPIAGGVPRARRSPPAT